METQQQRPGDSMAGNKARLVRLSTTQWENVDLFGGLGKIVRDYLAGEIWCERSGE